MKKFVKSKHSVSKIDIFSLTSNLLFRSQAQKKTRKYFSKSMHAPSILNSWFIFQSFPEFFVGRKLLINLFKWNSDLTADALNFLSPWSSSSPTFPILTTNQRPSLSEIKHDRWDDYGSWDWNHTNLIRKHAKIQLEVLHSV